MFLKGYESSFQGQILNEHSVVWSISSFLSTVPSEQMNYVPLELSSKNVDVVT
jgi:hypothetical protein